VGPTRDRKEGEMPLWLIILIIVLVVLALGGVGYTRY
jgi:flagellar basal body-associated protein FliL